MARFSLSPEERKTKRRDYTRENRAMWKKLGYRMMSAPVHDDDRELVLAELEVRRGLRLSSMAKDPDTSMSVLIQIGRRNLTPCPVPSVMNAFLKEHKRKDEFLQIEDAVENAKKALTMHRNARTNIERVESDSKRQRLYAKEVAYGNLASAWFGLAEVRAKMGDTTLNVFDMKDEYVDV